MEFLIVADGIFNCRWTPSPRPPAASFQNKVLEYLGEAVRGMPNSKRCPRLLGQCVSMGSRPLRMDREAYLSVLPLPSRITIRSRTDSNPRNHKVEAPAIEWRRSSRRIWLTDLHQEMFGIYENRARAFPSRSRVRPACFRLGQTSEWIQYHVHSVTNPTSPNKYHKTLISHATSTHPRTSHHHHNERLTRIRWIPILARNIFGLQKSRHTSHSRHLRSFPRVSGHRLLRPASVDHAGLKGISSLPSSEDG